jgi:hypothetical protein
MNDTMHAPRWRRLLDGGRTWGSLDVSPSRYGVTRHRLVVFPPGISSNDRVLLRVWRTWPIWATLAWLVMEMFLVPTIGSGPAVAISTTVTLSTVAAVMATTGATRTRVRTLAVVRMAGFDDPMIVERYSELYELTSELAEADHRLAVGELSAVQHEAVVWGVYERLATPVPAEPSGA